MDMKNATFSLRQYYLVFVVLLKLADLSYNPEGFFSSQELR